MGSFTVDLRDLLKVGRTDLPTVRDGFTAGARDLQATDLEHDSAFEDSTAKNAQFAEETPYYDAGGMLPPTDSQYGDWSGLYKDLSDQFVTVRDQLHVELTGLADKIGQAAEAVVEIVYRYADADGVKIS